jgi:hypothetical protein
MPELLKILCLGAALLAASACTVREDIVMVVGPGTGQR